MKRLIFCIVSLLLLCNTVYVSADWENDGEAKSKASECYGDSGYTSSFKNVKYYDVALPYKETCKGIGGYATAGKEVMSSYSQKSDIGSLVMYEFSSEYCQAHCSSLWSHTGAKAKSMGYEKNIATMTDDNGITYYVMAIQEYFYKYTGAKKFKFDENNGQLVDVILTDGTCIHFIVGDCNASHHTNGGSDKIVEYFTAFAPLNYKYYRNLYAASNGNCPEIWGNANACVTNFRSKYKLDKKVRIAYYRMYNKKFGDKLEVTSDKCKDVSYDLGKSSGGTSSGGNGDNEETSGNKENQAVGATFVNGYYTEEQLSSYTKMEEINLNEVMLSLARSDSLNQEDLGNVSNWNRNVNNDMEDSGLIKALRVATSFLGILFTIWSIMLYVAFWFDRTNNIIDLDLVGKFTLGKLHTAMEDKDATFGRDKGTSKQITVSHLNIVFISLSGVIFGALLISGTLYTLISGLVNFVLEKFEG